MNEDYLRQKMDEYRQRMKAEEAALTICRLNEKEKGYSNFSNEIDHLVELRIYEGMIALLNNLLEFGGHTSK